MLSDAYKNIFLDSVLGANASSEMPSSVWIGFTDSSDVECTGTGYARIEVVNNGTNWPDAVDGLKILATDVDFAAVGANDWGSQTRVGVWDASAAGTMIVSARIAGIVLGNWPALLTPHIPGGTLKFAYR
jgi:hypothetical protein